jgi:hypothetical protein
VSELVRQLCPHLLEVMWLAPHARHEIKLRRATGES